jgi:hypothetical protein
MAGSQLTLQATFLEYWTGDPVEVFTDSCLQKFRSIIDERIPSQYGQMTSFGHLPFIYPSSLHQRMEKLRHRYIYISSDGGVIHSKDWWENGYNYSAIREVLRGRVRSALDGI